MTRNKVVLVLVIAGIAAAVGVGLIAMSGGKEIGPSFSGKSEEEVKAYFYSEEFQRLSMDDKIAVKKLVYGDHGEKAKDDYVAKAWEFSKLPAEERDAYLDAMIDKYEMGIEKKKAAIARKKASSGSYGKTNAGSDKAISKKKDEGEKFSADRYRSYSEMTDPAERAVIMELKDAMMERMDERGINSR